MARWRLILGLVACALALICGGVVAPAPHAAARPASSDGTVIVTSPEAASGAASGPVNALLTVEVHLFPANPTTYLLAVTTTAPDQTSWPALSDCASAQPLSGAPTVQVVAPQGGAVTFRWPASLGRGRYWLCARPNAGAGPMAESPPQLPFTVLTDAAPAVDATLTPAGAQAASGLTVTVTNWITDANAPPELVLNPADGSQPGVRLAATLDTGQSDPASGRYVFSAPLPAVARSGSYAIAAYGDCRSSGPCAVDAYSATFSVAVASLQFTGSSPTVTPTATPIRARGGPIPDHPTTMLLWGWVAAALLVLALLAAGLYALRRWR